jgi:hypothetical protein
MKREPSLSRQRDDRNLAARVVIEAREGRGHQMGMKQKESQDGAARGARGWPWWIEVVSAISTAASVSVSNLGS